MPQTFKFPDGMRVVIEELPHVRSVSMGFYIGMGAGHETHAVSGIAHFIEHMLFKGSERRPTPKQISDAVEGIGGSLDAYTSFEATTYYAKVANIHAERALDVLTDMLIRPRLDPSDVEKERRVISEELRQTADTPSELVHLLLDRAIWGNQPMGRDIAGDFESVAAMTTEQIAQHWRSAYVRSNLVISIAGNIQANQILDLITAATSDMPVGTPPGLLPSLPPCSGPTLSLSYDDSEQSNFCIGFPGLSYADRDRRAFLVLDTIIGGGMSSRLFQAIREDRALAYNIGSYSREYHDAGKWVIYGSVEPNKLEECVETVLAELRTVIAEGITTQELDQVKEQVKGGLLISLEDTWSVASRNGSHELRYGRVVPLEQVVAEVEAITVADVHRVAQRVIRPDALHLAVIGPFETSDSLRGLLHL